MHAKEAIRKEQLPHNKLRRYRTAPPKVKLTLYKMIIRPLLEYPCVTMCNISTHDKLRAQAFPNSCLRFVKNLRKSNQINMERLHNK